VGGIAPCDAGGLARIDDWEGIPDSVAFGGVAGEVVGNWDRGASGTCGLGDIAEAPWDIQVAAYEGASGRNIVAWGTFGGRDHPLAARTGLEVGDTLRVGPAFGDADREVAWLPAPVCWAGAFEGESGPAPRGQAGC